MKLFATLTALVGAFVAATATSGCFIAYFDEPEMPTEML